MKISTLGVVGAVQMGSGITQIAATCGLAVVMNDIKDEFVQRGMDNITKLLTRSVDKGKMTTGRIQEQLDLEDSVVRAPFAGVVSAKHTDVGAYVNVGSPVVSIINGALTEIPDLNISAGFAEAPLGATFTDVLATAGSRESTFLEFKLK